MRRVSSWRASSTCEPCVFATEIVGSHAPNSASEAHEGHHSPLFVHEILHRTRQREAPRGKLGASPSVYELYKSYSSSTGEELGGWISSNVGADRYK